MHTTKLFLGLLLANSAAWSVNGAPVELENRGVNLPGNCADVCRLICKHVTYTGLITYRSLTTYIAEHWIPASSHGAATTSMKREAMIAAAGASPRAASVLSMMKIISKDTRQVEMG